MAVKKVYELTQDGYHQLSQELTYLKDEKRPANLEALKEAREQGDLSENADFSTAKTEQAQIDARIHELEIILKNCKIIEVINDDLVNIGKTIKVLFLEKNVERTLQLVGGIEANPASGKISIDSPLGKAIQNHTIGDEVKFKSDANKEFSVLILDVIASA